MGLADRRAFPQIEIRDRAPNQTWTHIEGGLTVKEHFSLELTKAVVEAFGSGVLTMTDTQQVDACKLGEKLASRLINRLEP